jgi:putative endonuclease
MAEHNELGKAGEEAAVTYLKKQGYEIRHRNWHRGHLELDIVANTAEELVVVEVKTRKDTAFGLPQEAVNTQKIRRTILAADTYIKLFSIDLPVRFDIITVIGTGNDFRIEHIPEAFYPSVW